MGCRRRRRMPRIANASPNATPKTAADRTSEGSSGPITGIVNDQLVLPNNAFFIPPPFGPVGRGAVAFGETSSGNPVTTLDIVGHELMHGVTHFSVSRRTGSGLTSIPISEGLGPATIRLSTGSFPYPQVTLSGLPFLCSGDNFVLVSNHGGAVNAAFADVFGTSAEFFFQDPGAGPLRADYLGGEDIPELGLLLQGEAGPIRSLSNPASLRVDRTRAVPYPDHYGLRLRFAVLRLPSGLLA